MNAARPLLELEGLGKRFGSLQALEGVSISLQAGEIHCLLGENGAGKSTLCNLVFGVYRPDTGQMQLAGEPYRPVRPADALNHGIAMVHQHFSLVPDVSVVDNLLLGQARGRLDRRACADRVLALGERYGLPLDPHAIVSELSVGERQRVEIVKCLMRDPRLLVLDEPTAVLLPGEIQALLQVCLKVAAQGCGVVLVTHKLAEIRQIAHRATVLRGGRVVARSEAPADEMDALVRAMIQRDLKAVAQPAGIVLGAPAASAATAASAAAAMASAPNSAGFATSSAASTARIAATPATPSSAHAAPRMRSVDSLNEPVPPALMADGLSVRDATGVLRLDTFTVIVNPGEIVGVAGVEGNGQVELAGVLSGMATPTEGRFFIAGEALTGRPPKAVTQAGAGIVPEDRHATGCVGELSVAENIMLNRLSRYRRMGLLDRARLRRDARELMQRFDVRAASSEVAFGGLSGGNQQKAVLARELTTDNLRFLMAAQPTRGLDVGAVEAVYGHIVAACKRGVGVLLISSELDDLLRYAHRIVVLYRGRIMGECRADPAERDRIGAWMAGQAI